MKGNKLIPRRIILLSTLPAFYAIHALVWLAESDVTRKSLVDHDLCRGIVGYSELPCQPSTSSEKISSSMVVSHFHGK